MGGMGVIEGGWEFVWAAYGVFALVLAGYALSIDIRYRAERRRREREDARGVVDSSHGGGRTPQDSTGR